MNIVILEAGDSFIAGLYVERDEHWYDIDTLYLSDQELMLSA